MANFYGYGLICPVGYLEDVPTSFRIYADTVSSDVSNNTWKIKVRVVMGNEGSDTVKIYASCSTSLGNVGTIDSWGAQAGSPWYAPNQQILSKEFTVSSDQSFTISFKGRIGWDSSYSRDFDRSMSGTATAPHIDRGLAFIHNGSSYQAHMTYIWNGSWQMYMPYIWNGSSWELYT